MDLRLKDLNVLVTGAGGMIGLAIAQLFLEQGAKVAAHYNTTTSTLAPLQQKYASRLVLIQADLTSESAVSTLFDHLTSHHNFHTQILILNHGFRQSADVAMADMALEQWESTININLTSNFMVARGYLKGLREMGEGERAGAAIVVVGSTAGKVGEAGHGDYSAAKSAMMYGFTLSLKNEIVKIAPRGRVNCVAPGWVKTPAAEEALDRAVIYRATATIPLKKFARPEDIAHQIVILASPVSGHVSGEVVVVSGGMEGRLLNLPEDV
ncbi:hypothetical protein M422DRAFT_172819 [Sphaerobolus stellatus SS14]|uniref:3-oxoacyl-[acyl-carrier-protein] reductase n=1 Tax=Sphaerobolus stellatus (strain SS14) TaxID=990650 RepID=A0A0C9V205_SPHS4|nr:hypothetical protein M422DRAFT_273690 [Sphaerobolus stellatus SS14]KIJ41054.1 hypothetical protein M422DRAFT_172819 [Sphaerobolus stellatus SS14]